MLGVRVTVSFLLFFSFLFGSSVILKKNNALREVKEEKNREEYVVSTTVDFLTKDGVDVDRKTLEGVVRSIYRVAKTKGVDYRIVLALAKVESNFRNDAVSPKGARGILQIKPSVAQAVAKDLGIKLEGKKSLHESEKNIVIGTHLLSSLIDKYFDIHGALSAYNMGQTRLAEKGKNYETKFSKLVLKEYKRYIEILPDP
ncbi:MAG: transglycosylase SLT domain-containing protein [Desulfobacterota bacterium]|nr:transglycosylase SLT domain-containing protein [Thermodesulfobacteriota bacterium]MDW8001286.1 transglycosylase SLT domain-containing protein [Deltaproteobacteria bacterium]